MTPEEAARLVEAHSETIARACVLVARRSAFTADQAALFRAWVDRQFAADQYALIRRLRFEQLDPDAVLSAIIPVLARAFREPAPSMGGRRLVATRAGRDQSDVYELRVIAADVVVVVVIAPLAGHLENHAPDEAVLIKVYDSAEDVARFSAHTAFEDPTTPDHAPARESIEARTLVIF